MSTASDARHDVLESLRRYVESYQSSVVDFARWMELPVTDANALGEIMWAESTGRALSPTALATRLAITTGAASALINRLEGRGLVVRSREHEDRRTVTLRATPEAQRRAAPFQADAATRLDAALGEYDDEQLVVVRDFIDRFAAILPSRSDDAPRA